MLKGELIFFLFSSRNGIKTDYGKVLYYGNSFAKKMQKWANNILLAIVLNLFGMVRLWDFSTVGSKLRLYGS